MKRATNPTHTSLSREDAQNLIVWAIDINKFPVNAESGRRFPINRMMGCWGPSKVDAPVSRQVETPELILGKEGLGLHILPSYMPFGMDRVSKPDADGFGESTAIGASDGWEGFDVWARVEDHIRLRWRERWYFGNEGGRLVFITRAVVIDILKIARHGSVD